MFIYKNQEETLKAKKFTDSIFLSSAELRIGTSYLTKITTNGSNSKWMKLPHLSSTVKQGYYF